MALRKWADPEGCCCNVDASLQYGMYLDSGFCRIMSALWREVGRWE